jgi:quercetin dioxygenase-like cupin family protein
MSRILPHEITSLPRADIPVDGVVGYLFQGTDHQIVFMEFAGDVAVPSHSHGAQWGVVLEGHMDLVIGEVERTYRKGDHYSISSGVSHSARVAAGSVVMDFFEDPNRYKPK